MANPPVTSVQNLLPVQAYFDINGNFQTFIGQGKPFYAIPDPDQSGLHITNSTIDSSVIGGITPSTAYFTSAYVSNAPTVPTGIANKQYVDYYAAGLSWKQPVKAASLSNIASLSGFQTIDTVPLTDGDRILVKNQSLSKDNGIYVVRSGAWEYAVGADDWQEYVGAIVFVEEGSQAYSAWYSLAQEGGTLGVTALNWANFSVSSTYTAGTGLTLTGYVFSITNTGVVNGSYGSSSKTVTLAINAQGQATSASQQDIAIAATQITSGTIDSARLSGSYSGITGLGTLGSLTVTNPISGSVTGNAGSATNLGGGATGSIPYQTATNTTGFLAASTDGYILSLVSGVPSWIPNTVGTVTAVTASAPLASSGGSTPNITITQASGSSDGYLSSANWTTFNNKANSGANSDITSMTGITGGISTPDYIAFDTTYATTLTVGQLGWDGNNTLGLGMSGGNIVQQIGLQTFIYGKASSAITKGQLIQKTGSNGSSGVITFAPTTANMTDSGAIIGIAAENISLNAFGYVISSGTIKGFDTSGSSSGETWADGDTLYYNPTGNGLMTKTKPSAPNMKTEVAIVVNAGSGGSGSVAVEIIHGTQLGGTDSNVQITSPSNGQIITYDGGNTYWKNTTLTAGTGISVSSSANGVLTIANTVTGGLTITDDTTTNATRYLTFTSATSGTITGENVSSTKLQFNPSTGLLTSTGFSGSGANLTSLNASNISSGTLSVSNGGTGQTSLTANNVILGNGNSAVQFVAPSTAGNVLTSNGTTWTSSAPGPAGISWQAVQTGNFNAVAGRGYPVNTTSTAITATLPASPSAGDQIVFIDYAGTLATRNLILNLNGNKLNGNTSNVFLNTNRECVSLVYVDSTQGWLLTNNYLGTALPETDYSVSYLVIAGGGGGGAGSAGGGGAGGYRTASLTLSLGTTYTVTVGAGGAGGAAGGLIGGDGSDGSNSVFSTITSIGGGGGGGANNTGRSGGSGGGGLGWGSAVGGAGTSGQGSNGGTGYDDGTTRLGGGGGGAGAVGSNFGTGGNGSASSITGSSVTRAGGGGGGAFFTYTGGGGGGAGGGGSGGGNGSNGGSGSANTGGGGGGSGTSGAATCGTGGNGGSGVVILSIPTSRYSGTTTGSPTVTTSGSNTILQFNSSGSYTA